MSDFIVEKLSKSVGDKTVFRDISFIIHDLDRIGLIVSMGLARPPFWTSFLVFLDLMGMSVLFQLKMITRLVT